MKSPSALAHRFLLCLPFFAAITHQHACECKHDFMHGMQKHLNSDDVGIRVASLSPTTSPPPLEVIPLIVSGPASNRIDLVFFSDGYLLSERDNFFVDALRLAVDVSKNKTFNTVRPLLNFWAAFSPSNQTGLGVNGPNESPFGLYRVGTELRAVYYGHPEVARAACDSLGAQCDYPILLGNDPRYGGLGGDFTVITSSILNGPLVLRHELGHSILDVGEEYDGGEVYNGSNSAHDIRSIPWSQWLSDPNRVDDLGNPRIERSVMSMQAYPWTLLNTTSPWSVNFTSSGTYSRISLDGVDLEWTAREDVGEDRWFYDFVFDEPLKPGPHFLTFELLNPEIQGLAQLCSVEIVEYGDEHEFILKPGFHGVFPTFSYDNQTSFRPTNQECLMRAVAFPNFCKACLETLWLKLLERISLIDNLTERCERRLGAKSLKILDLDLLPLANLRQDKISWNESFTIIWKKNGAMIEEFTNRTRVELGDRPVGNYSVHVKFATEEVRKSSQYLEAKLRYEVRVPCAG